MSNYLALSRGDLASSMVSSWLHRRRVYATRSVDSRAEYESQIVGYMMANRCYFQAPIVKGTIERYKKACSSTDTSTHRCNSEANTQFYQQEAAKLRTQIGNLQNQNRHMLGEAIGSMSTKDLKSLEIKLEKGISRIRSKKNEMLFQEIEYMQKREVDLHNNNQLLRAKIAENERSTQQNMNLMPAAGGTNFEIMQPSQPFDSRNFFQVNALQPANNNYPRQDQVSLQLV
ncbi:hypothetical protein ACFE04_029864 [Oxalis oulophora]